MTFTDTLVDAYNKDVKPEVCADFIFKQNLHYYFQAFQDDAIKRIVKRESKAENYAIQVLNHVIKICKRESDY